MKELFERLHNEGKIKIERDAFTPKQNVVYYEFIKKQVYLDACEALSGRPFVHGESGHRGFYILLQYENADARTWHEKARWESDAMPIHDRLALLPKTAEGTLEPVYFPWEEHKADALKTIAEVEARQKVTEKATVAPKTRTAPENRKTRSHVETTWAEYTDRFLFKVKARSKIVDAGLADNQKLEDIQKSQEIVANGGFCLRSRASGQPIVDADFDWAIAGDIAAIILPAFNLPAPLIMGRKSKPISHMLWTTPGRTAAGSHIESVPNKKYTVMKGRGVEADAANHANTIAEFRTSGWLMVPPSINEYDEKVYWETPYAPPPSITQEQIKTVQRFIASAAFLAYLCHTLELASNGRHNNAQALALICKTNLGLPLTVTEQLFDYCWPAWETANDGEYKKSLQCVRDMYQDKYKSGLAGLLKKGTIGLPPQIVEELEKLLADTKTRGERSDNCVEIGGNVREMSDKTLAILAAARENDNPVVFKNGDTLVRVIKDISQLELETFKNESRRHVSFIKATKTGFAETDIPDSVVKDILSTPISRVKMPEIIEFTDKPIFTADGKLHTKRGYDEATGVFLHSHLSIPDVPEHPTREQVDVAVATLMEPIERFPFVDPCDRAHTFALMIEDFCRNFFRIAPFRIVNKTGTGTGGSLLISTALHPAVGNDYAMGYFNPQPEESRKAYATWALSRPRFIVQEEAHRIFHNYLNGAGTSPVFNDRLLSTNTPISIPNRWTNVFIGNDVQADPQIVRRSLPIYLDAQMEDPTKRKFTLDLETFMPANRERHIHAALTVIQSWVSAGMPLSKKALASFEVYSRVIGGILEHAGVEGFLDVSEERMPITEKPAGDYAQRRLVMEWVKQWNNGSGDYAAKCQAGRLYDLAEEKGIDFSSREGLSNAGIMARKLTQRVYQIGDYRVQFRVTGGEPRSYSLWVAKGDDALQLMVTPDKALAAMIETEGTPF